MGSEPSEKTASDGLNLNVKTLLSTGLLEGISVSYIHHGRNKELPGIIKGVDYCCGCTECNFNQVFSARKFEAHAGSKSSHSNNHIFLKNGKSLHNVVKKLGDLSLESIGEVIEGVIGERPNFECYEAWKASKRGYWGVLHSTCSNGGVKNNSIPIVIGSAIGGETETKSKAEAQSGSSISGNSSTGSTSPPEVVSLENAMPKMPRKAVTMKIDVRTLLSTGLLEGFTVKYVFQKHQAELLGIIDGVGYCCGCSECKFNRVLCAKDFERHAGCKSSHPNNHILLENGRSLYMVAEELGNLPLESLGVVIERFIGQRPNLECYAVWKEAFLAGRYRSQRACEDVHQTLKMNHNEPHHNPSSSKLDFVPGSKKQDLLANEMHGLHMGEGLILESQEMAENISCGKSVAEVTLPDLNYLVQQECSIDEQMPKQSTMKSPPVHYTQILNEMAFRMTTEQLFAIQKSRTRNTEDLHQLVFGERGLPDNTPVGYRIEKNKYIWGRKRGKSIVCNCCNGEMSPEDFEAHVLGTRLQPSLAYYNIFCQKETSLHEFCVDLSNTLALLDNVECTVCNGPPGQMSRCSRCSRTYHKVCLELKRANNQLCCSFCIVETGPVDHSNETSLRATALATIPVRRIIKHYERDAGSCVICRKTESNNDVFSDLTMVTCNQCERKYHVGCMRNSGIHRLKEMPQDKWSCSEHCKAIYPTLETFVSRPARRVSETLCRKTKRNAGSKLHWQLLGGNIVSDANFALFSKAAAIFLECFYPITVHSGFDIIPPMVCGMGMSTVYGPAGMYCAVLTVKSSVLSVALLRIFGKVAELPLVATKKEYQRKGFFRCLLSSIEGALTQLNVDTIVVPAAEDASSIWTDKLGFQRVTDEQLREYINDYPLVMFEGTSMFQKKITQ